MVDGVGTVWTKNDYQCINDTLPDCFTTLVQT